MIYARALNENGGILQMGGMPGEFYKNDDAVIPLGSRGIKREPVTLYKLVNNEVPGWTKASSFPEDYGNNCLEVYKKDVLAYTVYCDSEPWDGKEETMNKSGNGSKQSPFRNVLYALQMLWCYDSLANCDKCNFYVRLRVSGMVNYSIRDTFPYYFMRNLILDGAEATFDYTIGDGIIGSDSATDSLFGELDYVYNCNINVNVKCQKRACIEIIRPVILAYNCKVTITQTESNSNFEHHIYVFDGLSYNCRCYVKGILDNDEKSIALRSLNIANGEWNANMHYNLYAEFNVGIFSGNNYLDPTSILYNCTSKSTGLGTGGVYKFMYGCNAEHKFDNDVDVEDATYHFWGDNAYNSTFSVKIKTRGNCTKPSVGGSMYNTNIDMDIEAAGGSCGYGEVVSGHCYNVSLNYKLNITPYVENDRISFSNGLLRGFYCPRRYIIDCSSNFSGKVNWPSGWDKKGYLSTCGTYKANEATALLNFNEGNNICSKTNAQIDCEREDKCEDPCDCSRYNK